MTEFVTPDRLRVLLIDDARMSYLIIQAVLAETRLHGLTLDWVSNYDEGLVALSDDAHDLCLLDYNLGDRNGIELLEEALQAGSCPPVIMLTGASDHDVDLAAMQAGAADYLDKEELNSALVERALRYALQRRAAVQALKASEERYALAARGTNDGIWDWNLQDQTIYFSPRWKALLGYGEDELSDSISEWYQRVHPDDLPGMREQVSKLLASTDEHFETGYRMLHKDTTFRWMLCRGVAVRNGEGAVSRLVGSQADVTLRAAHDALTGLPNRALFLDRLERAVIRWKRHSDYMFAVLFLDLDRFKLVNDSLGHVVGDDLLVAISERLDKSVRASDTVARFGGDEFAMLLDNIAKPADATKVAAGIQEALRAPIQLAGREVFTGASIGIALSSTGYTDADDMLRDADTAMYRAKDQGRGCYEVFDQAMHESAVEALHLESDLRHGLESGDFECYYQPIVDLPGGNLHSFEALVRWRRNGTMVLPDAFMHLAEETGLITAIDRIVLRQACRQLQLWEQYTGKAGAFSVSVNLSCRHFKRMADWSLLDEVKNLIEEFGLQPHSLVLEITEHSILDDPDHTGSLLNALRDYGIKIAIDDFGTGYSSLKYLHTLPCDILKIDQSFVKGIETDGADAAIAKTIVGLAKSLNLKVTAEGVETEFQREWLTSLGCEFAQGYLMARPLPADATFGWLQEAEKAKHADEASA